MSMHEYPCGICDFPVYEDNPNRPVAWIIKDRKGKIVDSGTISKGGETYICQGCAQRQEEEAEKQGFEYHEEETEKNDEGYDVWVKVLADKQINKKRNKKLAELNTKLRKLELSLSSKHINKQIKMLNARTKKEIEQYKKGTHPNIKEIKNEIKLVKDEIIKIKGNS